MRVSLILTTIYILLATLTGCGNVPVSNHPIQQLDIPVHAASTPIARDQDAWIQTHKTQAKALRRSRPEVVFIGDSLTAHWEYAGREVFEACFGSYKTVNLGIHRDRTQHVLWRVNNSHLHKTMPALIVLQVGTNNLLRNAPAEVLDGISATLQTINRQCPQTRLLLLGLLPRGQQANDPYRSAVQEVNQLLRTFADQQSIPFLDCGEAFLEADESISCEVMPDYLHLSPEGYRRWGERLLPLIQEQLRE